MAFLTDSIYALVDEMCISGKSSIIQFNGFSSFECINIDYLKY